MPQLITPLPACALGSENPVHRALRAQVALIVEQRRDDLARRPVDEARFVEDIANALAFRR